MPAQPLSGALPHQHLAGPVRRRRSERLGQGPQVGVGRHVVGAGGTVVGDLALHPGEPEHPGLGAVGVVADDVPPAAERDHTPGLQVPGRDPLTTGGAVVEPDGGAGAGGVPERLERRLLRRQLRLHHVERVPVDGHAGRLQLDQGVGGGGGEAGVLPDPRGQPDDGGLLGLEVDVGQLEGRAVDPVARLVLERAVDVPDLDRDAEGAQLLLVALEHLLERVVAGLAVGLDDRAQPVLGDVGAGHEQSDEQVEQALTLAGSHLVSRQVHVAPNLPQVSGASRPPGCPSRTPGSTCR